MARYQLRRPSPVKIVPRRVRRQVAVASSAPVPEFTEQPEAEEPEGEEVEEEEVEEVEEGPESPDSPGSSGSESSDSDSDSEDEQEPPSPAESGAPPTEQALPAPSGTNGTSITSAASSVASQTGSVLPPPFTLSFSSQGNLGAAPQITDPAASTDVASSTFITRPRTTSSLSEQIFVSSSFQPASPPAATVSLSASTIPAGQPTSVAGPSVPSSDLPLAPAQSETAGSDAAPQKSAPQEEKTMISRSGAAAAITLSVIGAIAILIGVIVCIKRRKRRQNQYAQRLADDAFDPNNGALNAPETAHVARGPSFLAGGGSHLTRSTDRSDSLFGAGAYQRPETVSTERNKSRFPVAPPQPTPNPFADPPLNKAYDVLAGRPRSTTLTDRGSWVKNPFHNPESERFDPFGELQEKARVERRRYLEESRNEAEEARIKEVERQFGMKEAMGLGMPEQARKGSGATVGGLGVLDRSGGLR